MGEVAKTDPPESVSLLNIIADAARNPDTNIANMQALLQMQREVLADQAKRSFARALWQLKKDLKPIPKNGTIDMGVKGKFKFARWEDMAAVIDPLMDREGFTLSFDTEERAKDGGGSVIIGELTHIDGHSRTARFSLPLDTGPGRNNLQAAGSTLSYGKRYVAEMLLNIVRHGDDDDGLAGGTRYISAEQKDQIVKLLKETKADVKGYLQHLGVNSVDEIEEKNATAAVNALVAKKNKMKAKENEGNKG
jgi:ERF superfamily